jgi:hypothetical protein
MDKAKPASSDGNKKSEDRNKRPAAAGKPAADQASHPQDQAAPGELTTGEGTPGLTVTGGGGHA